MTVSSITSALTSLRDTDGRWMAYTSPTGLFMGSPMLLKNSTWRGLFSKTVSPSIVSLNCSIGETPTVVRSNVLGRVVLPPFCLTDSRRPMGMTP